MAIWKRIGTAWAAAAAAALALSSGNLVKAESSSTRTASVSVVSGDRGAYRINGSFRIEAPATVAWGVLTDYDNLPSFVSSMRSSAAARDESGRLLVTQHAVGRFGPFSRRLHVVLEVTEQPPARLGFRDVCGASFQSYVGAWTIDPDGDAVLVTYILEARPRFAPRFFARSILASNARSLLEQVRLEMLRRGRTASAR